MEQLPDAALLDLIEQTKEHPQSAGWWYECYTYLSRHRELSRWPPGRFAGRSLIPLGDGSLCAVPGEVDKVVCLPSLSLGGERTPPRLFDQVFVWVSRDLAALILQGDSSVRSWLVDRLALTPFEATQLLPRAVRKLAPRIFGGELEVTALSLERSWLFMKWVVGDLKGIHRRRCILARDRPFSGPDSVFRSTERPGLTASRTDGARVPYVLPRRSSG